MTGTTGASRRVPTIPKGHEDGALSPGQKAPMIAACRHPPHPVLWELSDRAVLRLHKERQVMSPTPEKPVLGRENLSPCNGGRQILRVFGARLCCDLTGFSDLNASGGVDKISGSGNNDRFHLVCLGSDNFWCTACHFPRVRDDPFLWRQLPVGQAGNSEVLCRALAHPGRPPLCQRRLAQQSCSFSAAVPRILIRGT